MIILLSYNLSCNIKLQGKRCVVLDDQGLSDLGLSDLSGIIRDQIICTRDMSPKEDTLCVGLSEES